LLPWAIGSFTLAMFVKKPSVTATLDCTCLGHLGWCNTDRIVSIYVALPKVAKASKACCCHVWLSPVLLC